MRSLTVMAALVLAASSAAAQANKAATKPDTSKAPNTAAKTAAPDTKTQTKTVAPDTKTQTKAAAPDTKAQTKQGAAPAPVTKAPAVAVAPPPQAAPKVPTILREVFDYGSDGRRDPFVTLLSSNDLRPTVNDLRLTGILYDENGPNSIAVMRDLTTDEQYRVVTGQTLGRMKVVLIKRKSVIFSIEAFGLNRQDSLVLGDSTRARAK
jgi:hypothetical protein